MKQLERCPKCGEDNLNYDGETFEEDGILKINVECMECNHEWIEVYQFLHNIDADTHELIIESEE